MKKIFTLLLSSLFSLTLLAYDGSRLSISTTSKVRNEFKVEIDGGKYNLQDNSITISNLSEGNHHVRIYRDKKRNGQVFGSGHRQEIVYSSNVFLKRGFHLDITVNRFGKAFVDERRISRNDDWFGNDQDEYYDDNDWNNGYGTAMNNHEFENVKESIRKEWLESNRLTSAKFIVDKNYFSTRQVRELMQLFSFENNKLEIAKYAYRKTVDRQNYYQVNDAFSYSNSREELMRYIREYR